MILAEPPLIHVTAALIFKQGRRCVAPAIAFFVIFPRLISQSSNN